MSFIRPATPGFLVTLTATILLAVVTFSVPYFKSVYFLKASLSQQGTDGSIIFGTLGYCSTFANGTVCSKPSIGYELNINSLVGNKLPIEIPNVLVKWITYALFLHAVALVLAAVSAVFGLLAHVREMSMACCSTCISGFSAAVALLAFIFDIALFFIARARINAVPGGSASIGSGIWLTLAAWVLLFFAGCFYGFGRCCIRRRPRRNHDREQSRDPEHDAYTERVRLEAVKAEAERKARQKHGEVGLPAFQEYEQTQPLNKHDADEYIDDGDQIRPYRPNDYAYAAAPAQHPSHAPSALYAPGGYAQAAPGTRAVDEYYNAGNAYSGNSYPPRAQTSPHVQDPSYTPAHPTTTPPLPSHTRTGMPQSPPSPGPQYLASNTAYNHTQYPTTVPQAYGHTAGGTSYHSATSHQQQPSNYSTNHHYTDHYPTNQASQGLSNFSPEVYNATGYTDAVSSYPHDHAAQYSQPQNSYPPPPAERSYTLGGGGYGMNSIPDYSAPAGNPMPAHTGYQNNLTATSHTPPPLTTSPAPIRSTASPPAQSPTSPRGPRPPVEQPVYEDSPPMYDAATSQPPGQWNAKR